MEQFAYERKSHKDITVVIPTMVLPSRIPFFKKALASVINQNFEKDRYEIIVSSDSYTINDIINPRDSDNILVVIDPSAYCLGAKLYNAIAVARGTVIAFCEDDDEFSPVELSYLFENFNNRSIDYMHVNYDIINGSSKKIYVPTQLSRTRRAKKLGFIEFDHTIGIRSLSRIVKSGVLGNVSCVSIRKTFIKERSFLLKDLNYGIDAMLFFISLVFQGKMAASGEKLTRYRIHQENTSKNMMVDPASKVDGKFLAFRETRKRVDYLRGINREATFNKLLEIFILETKLITEITLNSPSRRYVLHMLIELVRKSGIRNEFVEESFLIKSMLYVISRNVMNKAISYTHRR